TAHSLLPAGGRRAQGTIGVAMTEIDAASIEIVGRHLDHDLVADAGADAEFAHFSGHVGKHFVIVIELDPIISVRQHLGHDAFEFEQFFLRHQASPDQLSISVSGLSRRRSAARACARSLLVSHERDGRDTAIAAGVRPWSLLAARRVLRCLLLLTIGMTMGTLRLLRSALLWLVPHAAAVCV